MAFVLKKDNVFTSINWEDIMWWKILFSLSARPVAPYGILSGEIRMSVIVFAIPIAFLEKHLYFKLRRGQKFATISVLIIEFGCGNARRALGRRLLWYLFSSLILLCLTRFILRNYFTWRPCGPKNLYVYFAILSAGSCWFFGIPVLFFRLLKDMNKAIYMVSVLRRGNNLRISI